MKRTLIFKNILIILIGLNLSFSGCNFWKDDDISADAKSVAKDKADLVIIYGAGDSASSVTGDVTLAAVGSRITVITWSSSNGTVIANNGAVTQPSTANAAVTLTATISKGSESDTKVFDLTVIKNSITGGIPRAGLVVEYLFGGSADDTSGNNNHGTLGAATAEPLITEDRFGNSGNAYLFDGTDDIISFDTGRILSWPANQEKTISGWFQCNSLSALNYTLFSASFNGGGGDYGGYISISRASSDSAGIVIRFGDTVGTQHVLDEFNSNYDDNIWHNVVVKRNAISVIVYVDGEYIGEASLLLNIDVRENDTSGIGNNTGGSSGAYPFDGKIDDVRIYNRALSEEEIFSLYRENNYIPKSGLVAEYLFNGNANDTAGSNHGSNIGSPDFTGDCQERCRFF